MMTVHTPTRPQHPAKPTGDDIHSEAPYAVYDVERTPATRVNGVAAARGVGLLAESVSVQDRKLFLGGPTLMMRRLVGCFHSFCGSPILIDPDGRGASSTGGITDGPVGRNRGRGGCRPARVGTHPSGGLALRLGSPFAQRRATAGERTVRFRGCAVDPATDLQASTSLTAGSISIKEFYDGI